MPDLLDFFLYSSYNNNYKYEFLGKPKKNATINNAAIWFIETYRKEMRKALNESKHFVAPATIKELADFAKPYISLGNQTGEGWFLTAEMIELIHEGAGNIVCCQPFACLPNHIVGKGVIKELKLAFPEANIVAVDFDPGASEVNQLNRIKLMLAAASDKLKEAE